MISEEEGRLIAQYERLRRRLWKLNAEADRIDHELAEIEWRLPEEYAYPGDPPTPADSGRSPNEGEDEEDQDDLG